MPDQLEASVPQKVVKIHIEDVSQLTMGINFKKLMVLIEWQAN